MSEAINLAVPFFSQRSNRMKNRMGKTVAWETCNLTSLCMILNYLGITDDTPDVLIKKFLEKKYKDDDYTDWNNLQAACKDIYNIDEVLILCSLNGGEIQTYKFGRISKSRISNNVLIWHFSREKIRPHCRIARLDQKRRLDSK